MKKTLLSLAAVAALSMTLAVPAQAATESNGISLNGFTLNGFTLNGFTLNGWELNGIKINGVTLNTVKFNSVKWNGQTLNGVAVDVCEPTVAHTCTAGLRAIVLPNGERVALR